MLVDAAWRMELAAGGMESPEWMNAAVALAWLLFSVYIAPTMNPTRARALPDRRISRVMSMFWMSLRTSRSE